MKLIHGEEKNDERESEIDYMILSGEESTDTYTHIVPKVKQVKNSTSSVAATAAVAAS